MTLPSRVYVIGLDGATWDILGPWMDAGHLPTLASLRQQGTAGKLKSVVPPLTGPAFSSLMTGKNPGQHGVFDWLERAPDGYHLQPINGERIRGQRLWDILSNHGKRVGILNVPMTYPPRKVNGFLVSGLLTPKQEPTFTHPPELGHELKETFDYRILPELYYDRWRVDPWLEELHHIVDMRTDTALYLLETFQPDFFMLHFFVIDLIQHGLWHTVDATHPDHDTPHGRRYANAILELYQHIDCSIKRLVERADEDTNFLIISDHGFGSVRKYIYVNTLLEKMGFLKFKTDLLTRIKVAMFRLGITPARVYRLFMRLGMLNFGLSKGKGERQELVRRFFLSADNIDWSRTQAYAHGNIGQIFINTLGREPQGIVRGGEEREELVGKIIQCLKEVTDPETGEKIIQQIFRREEIYSGDALSDAPDILMLPERLEYQALGASEFISNQVLEPSFAFSGEHRLYGILIAAGPDIKVNPNLLEANLVDIAPTVLHLMNLPVPEDMDGQVVVEILSPDLLNRRSIEYSSTTHGEVQESGYSLQDEKEIVDRLHRLGYV